MVPYTPYYERKEDIYLMEFKPYILFSIIYKQKFYFRISGGMASTKDITSHVTANMRKHLAKQKWKV